MTDIFISYSHKDEEWKDELKSHLSVLENYGGIAIWEDRQINAGDNWYPAIKEAIQNSKIAILLISRDFLASDFVRREEIPELLKRQSSDQIRVIPLIIKPCAWQSVPWLADLQGATKNNEPLAKYKLKSFELDLALSGLVNDIDQLLKNSNPEIRQIKKENTKKPIEKNTKPINSVFEDSSIFQLPIRNTVKYLVVLFAIATIIIFAKAFFYSGTNPLMPKADTPLIYDFKGEGEDFFKKEIKSNIGSPKLAQYIVSNSPYYLPEETIKIKISTASSHVKVYAVFPFGRGSQTKVRAKYSGAEGGIYVSYKIPEDVKPGKYEVAVYVNEIKSGDEEKSYIEIEIK